MQREETARRFRREAVERIAEMMAATVDDMLPEDDGVIEVIETYAAEHDMTPLDPHPIKALNKSGDELTDEDYGVLNDYLAYERLERELFLEAKILLVEKLAGEIWIELQNRQKVAENSVAKIIGEIR